ncbi:MAG TPA: hypothetical protein VFP59_14415 [Candidatus Angelobacter sp.]|nr:hypothetical protein [Candidatus Angelobacter sp.]
MKNKNKRELEKYWADQAAKKTKAAKKKTTAEEPKNQAESPEAAESSQK